MNRMDRGQEHERQVAEKMRRHGWHVEPFGQGVFTDVVRDAMRRYQPKLMLRWLPDLIGVKGQQLRLVEAKTGRTDTSNWSIEIDSVAALSAVEMVWGLPVVIVWSDFTCNLATRLRQVRWEADPDGAVGSGTPYMLVSKSDQLPFEWAFGDEEQDAA